MRKKNIILSGICRHEKDFFDNVRGESVCVKCGQVIEKTNLPELESNNFLDDRLLFDDLGRSSSIASSNTDYTSSFIPYTTKNLFVRLRRLDSKTKSASLAFRNGFFLLKKLQDNLALSDSITQYAAYLYRKAYQKKIRMGGSITNMVYPAVYIACNELGSPRQIEEIVQLNQINKKQFFRGYKKLFFGLQIHSSLHNPTMILQRLGGSLGLSEITKRKVVGILSEAKKKSEFCGYNRATLAAAAVYLIANQNGINISQSKISKAFGISEVSLRNCYFKLRLVRGSVSTS